MDTRWSDKILSKFWPLLATYIQKYRNVYSAKNREDEYEANRSDPCGFRPNSCLLKQTRDRRAAVKRVCNTNRVSTVTSSAAS